ncbi:hypothetical protein [Escherichia coli]|uniref:hypothetical protein n=2 Tax=Escherichia coli TaxID=562 RepID=UPI0006A23087|nr:hypothetical protein [Escherichia coli]CTU56445.1 ydjO [Escherichia coli]CTZ42950.1 ydjO [Escherichia coli]
MMSLWDALRMNMMISYQELVRTFPNGLNRFVITDITGSAETYPVLIDTVEVKANKAGAAA